MQNHVQMLALVCTAIIAAVAVVGLVLSNVRETVKQAKADAAHVRAQASDHESRLCKLETAVSFIRDELHGISLSLREINVTLRELHRKMDGGG